MFPLIWILPLIHVFVVKMVADVTGPPSPPPRTRGVIRPTNSLKIVPPGETVAAVFISTATEVARREEAFTAFLHFHPHSFVSLRPPPAGAEGERATRAPPTAVRQ